MLTLWWLFFKYSLYDIVFYIYEPPWGSYISNERWDIQSTNKYIINKITSLISEIVPRKLEGETYLYASCTPKTTNKILPLREASRVREK